MSLLSVEHIMKTYGDKVLFDQISFHLSEKQRVGLIGVNGTGKSTLLKVLMGLEPVEQGEVRHAHSFRMAYLPQHPDLHEDRTVLDQIYYGDAPSMQAMRAYDQALDELQSDAGDTGKQNRFSAAQQQMDVLDAWDALTTAKTILTRLGLTDFKKPVKTLSGGQRKRVALARTLIQPADLILMDEPTNHLDPEIIEWLEGFLPQLNKALLLVTHDRYFLNRVANRIIELDQGQLYSYEGNYATFLEKKAEREEREIAGERKRQNYLRGELAWLRRGAKARTTKQKARIQRIEGVQAQPTRQANGQMEISIGANRLGKKVLELEHVGKSYDGKLLIRDFSYIVQPSERLGIIGPNGSGKTTLLNLLGGRTEPDAGKVETGETVKLGFYTQEHPEMNEALRVIEYIREAAEVVNTADGQVISAEQMLERFLFSRPMQWTYIRSLSGGERRRLYLLRILMEEPNVLFLDEPTNDLDTQTLSILEDYLEQFPGAVITVSHDRYFLDRVAERLLAFEGEGEVRPFVGNYSEYVDQRKQEKQAEANTTPEVRNAPVKKEPRKKLSYWEQQEWEGIEDRISALEQSQEALQQAIVEAGSDSDQVQRLFQEQKQVADDLEQAVERWSELSLKVEEIEQGN